MKIKSLKLACSDLDPSRFPQTSWMEIAVSGRSNVGKSSLLNTILGRRNFARISKQPGKTRTVNFYLVNDRFYLVDLPGYGYAKVSSGMRKDWLRAISGYIGDRTALGGVIQLVDSRHPPSKDDLKMLQRLVDSGRAFLVVLTKADKIRRSERQRVVEEFKRHFEGLSVDIYTHEESGIQKNESIDVPFIFFSSKTGEGKELIWRWVKDRISV